MSLSSKRTSYMASNTRGGIGSQAASSPSSKSEKRWQQNREAQRRFRNRRPGSRRSTTWQASRPTQESQVRTEDCARRAATPIDFDNWLIHGHASVGTEEAAVASPWPCDKPINGTSKASETEAVCLQELALLDLDLNAEQMSEISAPGSLDYGQEADLGSSYGPCLLQSSPSRQPYNTVVDISPARSLSSYQGLLWPERTHATEGAHDVSLQRAKEPTTCSLLHSSIEYGREGAVSLLLDYGADANEQDQYGRTSVHAAVHFRNDTILRLLLDRGVCADIADHNHETPARLAVRIGFELGLGILLEHGCKLEGRSRHDAIHDLADRALDQL